MKKVVKDNIIILIITMGLFILSIFFADNFNVDFMNLSKDVMDRYRYIRITFFALIFLAVRSIYYLIIRIIKKDKTAIYFIKYFLIVAGIMSVFLLLSYPGNWCWDEFTVINQAIDLSMFTWQGYLTILFYSYCLMVYFNPISIIIIQLILISAIIAYIMTKVSKNLKNKKLIYLFLVPLFLPAIISNNLYPLRLTLYSYIELLLLFMIYNGFKEKEKFNFSKLLFCSFLLFITIIWRTEAIFYLLFIPFMLILILKNKKERIQFIISILIMIAIYYPINNWQKKEDVERQYQYKVTAIINPLSMMLQDDLKGNAQENIDMINKVLIVDEIKKYPSYTDITSYWSTSVMQPNYIKEFNNLYKGFFGLVIDNPWSFVKARIKTMLSSSGLDKTPATMMNDFKTQPNQNSSYKTLEKQVLNQRLRWNFIKIINGNYFKNNIFRKIFWNYIPIVLVLGILLIYKLVKKEYILSILLLFVLVRVPLLFLTAAAHYFMYYFPTYLTGIYIIMLLIVLKLDKKRSKVK